MKTVKTIVESLNGNEGGDAFFLTVSYQKDGNGQIECKQELSPVCHGWVDLSINFSGFTPEILRKIADQMVAAEYELGLRK